MTHTIKHLHEWGTPLVHGALQTGAGLITDGWNASTEVLKKGERITLLGVDVNGKPCEFTVAEDVESDGNGEAVIPISPALSVQSPADNAVITLLNKTPRL